MLKEPINEVSYTQDCGEEVKASDIEEFIAAFESGIMYMRYNEEVGCNIRVPIDSTPTFCYYLRIHLRSSPEGLQRRSAVGLLCF